jgi:hypothetical protein
MLRSAVLLRRNFGRVRWDFVKDLLPGFSTKYELLFPGITLMFLSHEPRFSAPFITKEPAAT